MNIIGLGLDEVRTNAEGAAFKLGTIVSEITAAGVKTYKYVQYDNGTAVDAVAGDFAGYGNVALNTSINATVVTSDVSNTDGIGAGVLMAAIPDLGYGWVQTKGVALMNGLTGSVTDGCALTVTGAADGELDLSALHTDDVCARAIDASVNVVLLDCRS